jgi:NAD(P)H dehydrogenase (quinone)
MAPKIAIVYYSMYGHIKQLVCLFNRWPSYLESSARPPDFADIVLQADAELKGIRDAGGDASIFQ